MGKIKKILENELAGGTQNTDIYPVTSTKAVYDTNNKVLDDYIQHLSKTATFAGIATPATNPGTPDGPVFYIASEPGTYANFGGLIIKDEEAAILEWHGSWIKKTTGFATQQQVVRLDEKIDDKTNEINVAKEEALQAIAENEQSAITNFNAQRVTPEMLSESTKQLINASGGGTITNLADNEDIQSVNDGTGTNVLKFANRTYNSTSFSGKGYKILRKNIQDGKNILTQKMINEPNTIYEIRYDFNLNNNSIDIPDNCILKFEGGSFNDGTISYNNSLILSPKFTNVKSLGNIVNKYIDYSINTYSINGLMVSGDVPQIIDLQGESVECGNMHISRQKSITIKNGTLVMPHHYTFDPANYNFTLKNVTVIFNTPSGQETGFLGGTDSADKYPNIILDNCTFINLGDTYIQNIFSGRFNTVLVKYCKFIDCGMQIKAHDTNITDWNSESFVSFDHCVFKWNPNKKAYVEGVPGNRDAITCGTFDNIFVTNCTFDNITNSCLDCYTSSNVLFTNNKLHYCRAGIELKSIYRESDWSEGVGQGELPRNCNIIFSNNIIDNCNNAVSTFIDLQQNTKGDFSYFIGKKDKYKRNLLITGNIIYYTQQHSNNAKKYFIVGDPIENTLISNNIFYSEYTNYMFIRDRNSTDLGIIEHYNPTVIISGCTFVVANPYQLSSHNYSNYTIKNCMFKSMNDPNRTCVMVFGGSSYRPTNIEITDCENLKIEDAFGKATEYNIKCSNCHNIQVIIQNAKNIIEFTNCKNIESIPLIRYSGVAATLEHKNVYILNNSVGIIPSITNVNAIVLVDDSSYCRLNVSAAVNSNYKNIKPFETIEDLQVDNIPIAEYSYHKYNADGTFKKYTFIAALNRWVNNEGISDAVSYSGKFSERPVKKDIGIGFRYFCTDRKTIEGAADGIIIYHKGNDIWIDALGRVVS